ncbi:MAG: methylmalonyl-CoA mutase family protein [Cyclobacteriaceae bacterium]
MEKIKTPLFSEFPSISKEQWKEKAIKDLKGADFEKLVWKTLEGFEIEPFYTIEDIADLDYLQKFENFNQRTTAHKRTWINCEKIKVKDNKKGHADVSDALHGGAQGLIFEVDNPDAVNFEILLSQIDINPLSISFVCKKNPVKLINRYFEFLQNNNINLQQINGNLEYDPIGNYAIGDPLPQDAFAELAEVVKLTEKAPGFFSITVNSSHFHDSGASIVQEVAYTLNTVVEYIDKLSENGIPVEKIINKVQFSIAVGTDYFMEIAKLKVIRILFGKIAEAYDLKDFNPGDIRIHCFTALWSKTLYDPSVNMLRDTTIAMSAVIGGCNSLYIEPYDVSYKNPKSFLKRIARNISTIIKDESYLDKIIDPVAGSYYLENLIDKQLQSSWSLFQEIESKGGFLAAFEESFIQDNITAIRSNKLKRISQRRDIIVGTNQYPNVLEKLDPEEIQALDHTGNGKVLRPQRAAEEFEKMRLDTDKYVKKNGAEARPTVLLLEYGENVVMRKARATFSFRFFGTSGFNVVEGPAVYSIEDAVKVSTEHKAEIIVLCSSDDDYAAMGESFAQKFKSKSGNKKLVLAGYPADIVDKLKNAGFDNFVHLKSNAVETLRDFQKQLNII